MRLELLTTIGASRPPKNRKRRGASAVVGPARGGKGKKQGRVMGALRRVGALIWPERFPDIAAQRAERIRARRAVPRGFLWIWAAAVALAAAAFVMHLHVRFDIIQAGYALSRAQGEQRRLRLAQRELRLELATLKEPGRIEEQARELLEMERPDHERIIRLDERRSRRSQRAAKRR